MTTEQILEECKRVLKVINTPAWEKERRQQNWKQFHSDLTTDLKVSYPALFRMLIESGQSFDMNQLINFLQLREQMNQGIVPENNAHQMIGQSMVDKYVKPHLPN